MVYTQPYNGNSCQWLKLFQHTPIPESCSERQHQIVLYMRMRSKRKVCETTTGGGESSGGDDDYPTPLNSWVSVTQWEWKTAHTTTQQYCCCLLFILYFIPFDLKTTTEIVTRDWTVETAAKQRSKMRFCDVIPFCVKPLTIHERRMDEHLRQGSDISARKRDRERTGVESRWVKKFQQQRERAAEASATVNILHAQVNWWQ